MAPALESHLTARSRLISHGGVAGVVIGCVAALIIFILLIPLALRFFRSRHQQAAAQTGPPGFVPQQPQHPQYPQYPQHPQHPQQVQQIQQIQQTQQPYPYYPPPAGPPVYDNGSLEEGKPYASYAPPTAAHAASAAPGGQPRSALPPGAAGINTAVPPYPNHPPAGYPPQHYPSPASGYPSPITQQQRSPTLQSAAPSLAQTVASFFGRSNTHSTLSRSSTAVRSTAETTRSPVDEYSLGDIHANNNHMWPGPPGPGPVAYPNMPAPHPMTGYPGPATSGAYEPNQQYVTGASAEYYAGASAEYYAGAPLSPPSDAGPAAQPALPTSSAQPPVPANLFATNLFSMTSMNAAAAVPITTPSAAVKDPKLTAIRTESVRSGTPATDFSPLSPTSPPRQDGERGMAPGRESGEGEESRESSAEPSSTTPKAPVSASASLSPEPVEFMPLSPSFRPLVPSPRLPAPGTVNPRDVWAPGTEDERFVHVTAELDRIEQSPPPLALSNGATPKAESEPAETSAGEEQEHPSSSTVTDTPPTSDFEDAIVKTETPSASNFVDLTGKESLDVDVDGTQMVDATSQMNAGLLSPADMEQLQHSTAPQAGGSVLVPAHGSVPMVSMSAPQQDEFSSVVLATPETATTMSTGSMSPAQPYLFPPYHMIPPMGPNGAAGTTPVPLTPPQPTMGAPSFSTPLTVPGFEQRPASPMSNGSTPSRLSSSSPQAYPCDECGHVFDQIHKLNHHKRYHERPHVCAYPNCGMRFGTRTHLDRHVNDKHRKTRRYHCKVDDCAFSVRGGKSFPRKDNWRRHMVNKHAGQPVCEPIEVVDQPMTDAGPSY